MKNKLQSVLHKFGAYTTTSTPQSEINSFLKKLWPIETNVPLKRIGGKGDGGYLLPDDFEDSEFIFSPGVSNNSSFEEYFAHLNKKIFMADGSVSAPPLQHPSIHFIKKHIGSFTSDQSEPPQISFNHWVSESLKNEGLKDGVLQMDIEGSEYEVIHSMDSKIIDMFRIIIIEFHNLQQLRSYFSFKFIHKCFEKLMLNHSVVHIHENNVAGAFKIDNIIIPRILEVTFHRNDRFNFSQPVRSLPHHLDHKTRDYICPSTPNWDIL